MNVWEWIATVAGLNNPAGVWYSFWSGIGGDIGELTVLGAAIAVWRRHTCHIDHCWRFARHPHTQDGVTYHLCRKHHPEAPDKVTADHIRRTGER